MKNRMNKKGFTLAELLVVVAIVAVLVAISIPIFTSQLEKARESTDVANMRAAKAEAVSMYLSDESTGTFYYDADNGKLIGTKPTDGYGKGTTKTTTAVKYSGYETATAYTDKSIKVVISAEGEVTETWE